MELSKRIKQISKAWNDFFVLNKEDVTAVSNLINESWIRTKNYKIDVNNREIKEEKVFQKNSIKRNEGFIDIAKPYMIDLYNIIEESGFMITLTDKDGYILATVISPNISKNNNIELTSLNENKVGTNAMGTCLYLNKPVETLAQENYYKGFHEFTTSAAPIHDEFGKIIGCIGITGYADTFSLHTLGMATAMASAIENKVNITKFLEPKYSKKEGDLFTFEDIVGESLELKEAINLAKIVSKGKSNVLIMGESGTGKELFAQSIHNNSHRKDKPFVAINCGALPISLVESELFGYEGGAYTGAKKEGHIGKFELADGGTLFLDEIGEMPLSTQAVLLRVIQEKKVYKIGASKGKDIDIMIIAATNKNLFEAVQNNEFRGDLFYRLNVFSINIPPLRERKEDIYYLSDYFINKHNKRLGTNVEGITKEAMAMLKDYDWHGNIRELENTIERAVQISQNQLIDVKDLPVYIQNQPLNELSDKKYHMSFMEEKEYKTILEILERNKGNIKKAAYNLGIGRATMYRKLSKYKIDVDKIRN